MTNKNTTSSNNKGKDNSAMYEVSAISLTSDYEKSAVLRELA